MDIGIALAGRRKYVTNKVNITWTKKDYYPKENIGLGTRIWSD